jgi:DNA-binding response OmpR family regulator
MHALIIEPQILTSLVIEDALRDAGYTSVAMAVTEEEAVAAAEVEPPDLVTAAVKLETGSGIKAVETIRAKHDMPVLFITQRLSEVNTQAPDASVLKKPFLAADLPGAIAEAKSRHG